MTDPLRYNMWAAETRAGFVERQLNTNGTQTFIDWEKRIRFWSVVIGFSSVNAMVSALLGVHALVMDYALLLLVWTHVLTFSVVSIFYACHRIKMCENMKEAKQVVDDLLRSATVSEYMRMSNDFYNYAGSFHAGSFPMSQSFRAANRCDICGAEISIHHLGGKNVFKTAEGMERCKGLCGYKSELSKGESQ